MEEPFEARTKDCGISNGTGGNYRRGIRGDTKSNAMHILCPKSQSHFYLSFIFIKINRYSLLLMDIQEGYQNICKEKYYLI